MATTKTSLHEAALKARKAFLMGIGGGGDIIQTIPIMNYLKTLGVEEIYLAGISCQWWSEHGTAVADSKFACILRPTIFGCTELKAQSSFRNVALVDGNSRCAGVRRLNDHHNMFDAVRNCRNQQRSG